MEKRIPDSDAHVIAKHTQIALRGLLIVSLAATIAGFYAFPDAAYLAAVPIPILFILLLVARYMERNWRLQRLRGRDNTHVSEQEIAADEDAVGLRLILEIVGIFALAAIIVSATFFEWEIVGLAAAVIFLLAILIGLPYWPLLIAEARAAEHEKLLAEDEMQQDGS